MINIQQTILNALPIPNFFTWWEKTYGGTNFEIWAEEVLKMEKEGIVKI